MKTPDASFSMRISIVLTFNRGVYSWQVAVGLGCAPATVVRVARRILEQGERGLTDGRRVRARGEMRRALSPVASLACGWHHPGRASDGSAHEGAGDGT